jgi:hypothetical protein
MKRVRLAVVLLIAAALVAGTPALAAKRKPKPITHEVPLTCVADPADPDYGASGVATLTVEWSYFETFYGLWEQGNLSVSCCGLTPGVTYTVFGFGYYCDEARAFTPGPSGNGSVGGWVGFWNRMEVRVVREDGTLVLEGIVY